jgi:hypothetical protein
MRLSATSTSYYHGRHAHVLDVLIDVNRVLRTDNTTYIL